MNSEADADDHFFTGFEKPGMLVPELWLQLIVAKLQDKWKPFQAFRALTPKQSDTLYSKIELWQIDLYTTTQVIPMGHTHTASQTTWPKCVSIQEHAWLFKNTLYAVGMDLNQI